MGEALRFGGQRRDTSGAGFDRACGQKACVPSSGGRGYGMFEWL
jgi:hypothetical protein